MPETGALLHQTRDNKPGRPRHSYPLLPENGSTLFRSDGHPQRLLQGPRRVVRLCVFALLLPAVLITVPLYVRLVLYLPTSYPMMPTDQRLLGQHVSSFWCQGQWLQMNENFNVYTNDQKFPTTSLNPATHLIHSAILHDDQKRHWGFYLLKGSTVALSACASHDGAQVTILRGLNNLRRCTWIKEDNTGDDDEKEEVVGRHAKPGETQLILQPTDSKDSGGSPDIWAPLHESWPEEIRNKILSSPRLPNNTDEQSSVTPGLDKSEEREQNLKQLLRKVLRMSKSKKEILRILHTLGRGEAHPLPIHIQRQLGMVPKQSPRDHKALNRRRRAENTLNTETEDDYGSFEVYDKDDKNMTVQGSITKEAQVGSTVVLLPELRLEHRHFRKRQQEDNSKEENKSPLSSSEEALAACDGVVASLPLEVYRGCSHHWKNMNRMVYDVPKTATYYFVFWSDNEIAPVTLHLNLSLTRVKYDTHGATLVCGNTTQCSVPLPLWSPQEVLVEFPLSSTPPIPALLHNSCQSRVPVFLVFLILAPLLILFCASS